MVEAKAIFSPYIRTTIAKPVALVADALTTSRLHAEISSLDSFRLIYSSSPKGWAAVTVSNRPDPIYVDTAIKRWERYTGDQAAHAVTGGDERFATSPK